MLRNQKNLQVQYEPATIIISGEQSANYLSKRLSKNIFIPVKVDELAILQTIFSDYSKKAIINYRTHLHPIDNFTKALKHQRLKQYHYTSESSLGELLTALRKDGTELIVGGSYACELALEQGFETQFFYTLRTLEDAVVTAIKYVEIYRKELEQSSLFHESVHLNESGIMSTDVSQCVTTANNAAYKLLDIPEANLINKDLSQLFNKYWPISKKSKPSFDHELEWQKVSGFSIHCSIKSPHDRLHYFY
ncbi:PrpR N-terminal domain-containing protein [Geomicrobium sp. JCM 19055]|uniref:PrpR N-terminal domain-containing protein n=1 Tax=Geomicrobium sp. JCM 19055 TaxID=1460649 RepID=UPI00223546C2|nr:PrpR N-terminal domain-containing protein [Geomicrobium sp. JCM 19055]